MIDKKISDFRCRFNHLGKGTLEKPQLTAGCV